jgi:putative ABC transport system substrate-binding protein
MGRRAFLGTLAGGLLAAPLAVQAQQAAKTATIGILRSGSPPDVYVEVFRQGLRELGYVENRSIAIDVRYARGDPDQLVALARELAQLKVDVLVASGLPAIVAAKHATSIIPIVVAAIGGDPVADGIVASLARPGGNITGLTIGPPELEGKRLDLLKEAVPGLSRVVALVNHDSAALKRRAVESAARKLGVTLQTQEVRELREFEGAFAAMHKGRLDALMVLSDSLFTNHRARIVDLAAKSRLPAVYDVRLFPESGGLMSYGPNIADLFRRAATYVDKILKGARPADLPIEQPTKFELVINLKTAKALGLTIPPSLLLRADEVIE